MGRGPLEPKDRRGPALCGAVLPPARCIGEGAGRPGWPGPCGLGTAVRNEVGQVGGASLWSHAKGVGVHWRVINGVWWDPSGCRMENGLWGSRGDEGDQRGGNALDQGRGRGRKVGGERRGPISSMCTVLSH